MPSRSSIANQVRQALRERPWGTTQLSEHLGLDYRTVRVALKNGEKRGEYRRTDPGQWECINPHYNTPSGIRSRILRAIHVTSGLSVKHIARLSDSTIKMSGNVLRELTVSGDLERLPKRKDADGNIAHHWRLRDPDNFYLKFILEKEVINGKPSERQT